MAGRNQKDNADYFSHDADASSDEKLVYLESLFGHTGYALYFKMLEYMTRAEGFKLEWNEIKKAIYASKFGVSVTEFDRFVSECCREEVKAFRIEDGMIYSPGLIRRLQPLMAKREYNRKKYQEQKQEDTSSSNSATEKTQRKGKERKEEKNKSTSTGYTNEFERFWSAYPKKVGKGAAFKQWQRMNGTRPEIGKLIHIVEQHKRSEQWRKQGGQFIPNPQTWLSQERWHDKLSVDQDPDYEPEPIH